MARPPRRACWVCAPGGSNVGVCGDCRKVIASERKCRSSAACGQAAGHGRFGVFCAVHAAEIDDVRQRWFSSTGAALKVEAKHEARSVVASETPEPQSDVAPAPTGPPPKRRISREELAATVTGVVHAADRPRSYGDLATAVGVARNSSSLKRAVALAQERGWIALDNGRGFVGGAIASDD